MTMSPEIDGDALLPPPPPHQVMLHTQGALQADVLTHTVPLLALAYSAVTILNYVSVSLLCLDW